MKKFTDILADRLAEAFAACGYDTKYAQPTLSNRPDLCEYQCNGALPAAKAAKKRPMDIAAEVAKELSSSDKDGLFGEVAAAAPGFINIKTGTLALVSYLEEMYADGKLGVEDMGHGEKVIVDYGGANVAKPLHVGHLRSAVIGESIKRMARRLGFDAIGDVHLGDWGLQMGLIIAKLEEEQPDLPYFDDAYTGGYPERPPFDIAALERIYPEASQRSKEDAAFKEKAQLATFRLQEGYAPYRALWRHIMKVSLEDLKKNYANLDVTFDLWKGESDAQPYIPWLIKDLTDKGLAHESEGALVVDIAKETDLKELPPCIVRKSDGAALYATSDLGTILEREKLYHPAQYIYITDKRQELHFIQVFRVAQMAGYVGKDTKLTHIGFGTMNGRDGKPFKTRDGGVMRLEYLIRDMETAVFNRIMENRSMPEEEAHATAARVGLAALKYGDLSNQAAKDYVFDLDRFISFEGNTGPYILYTIVRIKSILAKYEELKAEDADTAALPMPENAQEKALMLLLARYSEVLPTAYAELAPHKLCQYIFELSNAFNSFYHDTKILSQEGSRRAGLVRLCTLTKRVLEDCIEVLGFSAPERM